MNHKRPHAFSQASSSKKLKSESVQPVHEATSQKLNHKRPHVLVQASSCKKLKGENDKIDTALQHAHKASSDEITQLLNKKSILERNLRKVELLPGLLCDIATSRELERELRLVTKRETLVQQQPHNAWAERIQQLQSSPNTKQLVGSLAAKAILSGIMDSDGESVFLDADRCQCGRLFRFELVQHVNVCNVCGIIEDVLVVAEDTQSDLLSFRNQKTSTETALTAKNKATDRQKKASQKTNKTTITVRKAVPRTRTTGKSICVKAANSDRVQSYRRQFLAQFDINAPDPPEEVFQLLYNEFANCHLLNSSKCRPTDFASKLKACDLYPHHSIKLSRMFNNEPMILMPSSLIDALVKRFEDVNIAAAAIPNFGKLPTFEMLTHLFLRAEQRDDIAAIFFIHKPATVLSVPDKHLRLLVDKCHELSKTGQCQSDWSCVPRSG